MNNMEKYIVTGVDGKLGGRVAKFMLDEIAPQNLIFTCPNINRLAPEKYEEWTKLGVTLKSASYDNKNDMIKAFKGGNRIYIVSGVLIGEKRVEQHKRVIDAAIEAGINHITYSSFLGATESEYEHVYVTPDHTATENYLKQTGIPYNAMRNNLYLENYLTTSVMLALMSDDKWYTTAGKGRATFIPKDDAARAAAACLLGKGEDYKAYNICGSESISQQDIVDLINELSGKSIEYCPVNSEEFFNYLDSMHIPRNTDADFSKSPVPWCGNDMVTNEASIDEGLMDVCSNDVELLTGRKPKTAKEIAKNYAYIWEKGITNWKDID